MKTNYWLIIVGAALVIIGAYREYPIRYLAGMGFKGNKEFWGFVIQNIPVLLFLIGMMCLAHWKCGPETVTLAMKKTSEYTSKFIPILVMVPLLIGLGIALGKFFEAGLMQRLTGKHWPIYVLGAAVISPTSQAFLGIVLEFSKYPELKPKLMYFLTAVPLLSLVILAMRSMGLGVGLSIEVYICNIICVILLLPFFLLYNKYATGSFL